MKRVRSTLCTGIMLVTLLIIGFLAVPVCLLTGTIGVVWNLGDRLLSKLSA